MTLAEVAIALKKSVPQSVLICSRKPLHLILSFWFREALVALVGQIDKRQGKTEGREGG